MPFNLANLVSHTNWLTEQLPGSEYTVADLDYITVEDLDSVTVENMNNTTPSFSVEAPVDGSFSTETPDD